MAVLLALPPMVLGLIATLTAVVCLLMLLLWRAGRCNAVQLQRSERLQQEKHEVELELASLQAASRERERALRLMQEALEASRLQLKDDFRHLSAEVLREREADFRAASQGSLAVLLQPFREQLQAFQQRVNQVHDESLRGNVSLAGEVRRLSEVGLQMSREAETLARALKGDKKLAGNWGEVQLERSLQRAL